MKHSILLSAAIALGTCNAFAENPTLPQTTPTTQAAVQEQAVDLTVPQQVDGFDDLNSFPDGRPTLVRLKPEERAWLRQMIAEGKLRLATEADKKAWEDVAQRKNRRIQKLEMDMGRTFAVMQPLEIPSKFPSGARQTGDVTFIILPGIPFPKTRSGSMFYDIGSGGWYNTGRYDDGEKEGWGRWPHNTLNSQQEGFDDLNSFPDGRPTLVRLKPEERAWLRQMIAEGKLRLATEDDKRAWEDVAQRKNRPIQKLELDMGRTYVVMKSLKIPSKFPSGAGLTGDVTFIILPGVPFPKTRSGSAFYDIGTGGWYQSSSYDDGEKEGRGRWPHNTVNSQQEGFDDLNSFPDGRPTLVRLKPEERAWLRQMIAEGKLRLATEADKKAWEDVAQRKNRPIHKFKTDMGRTYAILEPIEIPSEFPSIARQAGDVTFIILPGVPFPKTRSGATFYDIASGGWYSDKSYDDGVKRGRGPWPHNTVK